VTATADFPIPREVLATRVRTSQYRVHGETHAFVAAKTRLHGFIEHFALKFALNDPDVAEDLMQLAYVRLWELDPSRFGEEDQLYLRAALLKRMLDGARAEYGRFFERMTRPASGDTIVFDNL